MDIILYATKYKYTISQNALKNDNKFRSVINKALIWLKISSYKGNKLKVETEVKER